MRKGTVFVCKECGYESAKWLGRCPSCGQWNTFTEKTYTDETVKAWITEKLKSEPVALSKRIREKFKERALKRFVTEIEELDRVFGGGLVKGAVVVIGGDPGVGKSTLVIQIAGNIAKFGYKVLYVSGEESQEQIIDRCLRLNIESENLYVVSLSLLPDVLDLAEEIDPDVLIVDSIQTLAKPEIPSVPGSVTQVRECGAEFLRFAKQKQKSVILVGHVTKDGTLAGPRTLEHMVDVVFHLEGHPAGLRILRATKNRFGSTDEIGLFEMSEAGLREVKDPSQLFIVERKRNPVGVSTIAIMEGGRPLLVEVESLVSHTPYTMPQRNVTGYDLRRLSMILALIENRLGISLRSYDVFINVSRGLQIRESGADLGVAMAILSSYFKKPIQRGTVVVGEIGLTGEIKPVRELRRRLLESHRLGFKQGLVPKSVSESLDVDLEGFKVLYVNYIKEAVEKCFS